MRAFLKQFVVSGDFDDDELLKLLKPPKEGIWEFRIAFHPAVRIFGGFMRPGEFIATNIKDRNSLEKEGFEVHRKRSRSIWSTLCPSHRRMVAARKDLLEDFDANL